VSTVHAGEVSGKLDVVFERLSAMYEKNRILLGKLRSSLTYPLLMLFLAFVVVVFLVSFIVPTFARLFVEFEQALPLPTRMLMAFSGFITKGWWAIFIVLGLEVYVIYRVYRSEKGKVSIDAFVLKLPLARTIVLENFRIRFCSTMALLLSNGVGIIESLQNTEGIFRNSVFTSLIRGAIDRVKKGDRLSRSLASGQVFTSSLLGMIHAGEAGDRVPEVLDRIARNGEIELEERLKTLTSLLEPVIIMVIGIFVGFVVLSIMLPIFQINQMFG
jgi:type II secretory pathway component PulF